MPIDPDWPALKDIGKKECDCPEADDCKRSPNRYIKPFTSKNAT